MELSVLDLAAILPNTNRYQTFQETIYLAQHLEDLGYKRIWVAEHHNDRALAGRSPEVLISAIAAKTKTIRVGSGAVLLNNYSPFKIAEVFCTLNELYPERIDLGIGRSNSGPVIDFALQQDRSRQVKINSQQQILELMAWLESSFPPNHPFASIPIFTTDTLPEVHVLGSGSWSAGFAGKAGLRYVHGSFLNNAATPEVCKIYRDSFCPTMTPVRILNPKISLAVHVVCAENERDAIRQVSPLFQRYHDISNGTDSKQMSSPDDALQKLGYLPSPVQYEIGSGIPPKIIFGNPDQVCETLTQIAYDLQIEEFILQDMITEPKARLKSYELIAKTLL